MGSAPLLRGHFYLTLTPAYNNCVITLPLSPLPPVRSAWCGVSSRAPPAVQRREPWWGQEVGCCARARDHRCGALWGPGGAAHGCLLGQGSAARAHPNPPAKSRAAMEDTGSAPGPDIWHLPADGGGPRPGQNMGLWVGSGYGSGERNQT